MADYVHFSAEPVERLVQREILWNIKPFNAFWFSDESQYGWRKWCIENEYGLDGLRYAHRVSFTDDARILLVDTVEALDHLHREYSYISAWAVDADRSLASPMRRWDYRRLADQWDVLIISPHRRQPRREWWPYSRWDCASGVVFDVSKVILGPAIRRGALRHDDMTREW